ncbi:MAG: SsrA-binding protein SmpB [Patescibacteria group bacterium]|jgi:SsrA-binding protein
MKSQRTAQTSASRTLVENRRARQRFAIIERWEAGITLSGQEVKSLKAGVGDMRGSYVRVRSFYSASRHQQFAAELVNLYIPPYVKAGPVEGYEPRQTRRLLLRRQELVRLVGLLQTKGLTVVPLSLYTRNRLIKVSIGLGRGKTKVDRREDIKTREVGRMVRQRMLRP